jgi:biopolymer transport protein ExbB
MNRRSVRTQAVSAAVTLLSALPALAQDTGNLAAENALRAALPRDLSPWNMFLGADGVVKAVIVGLALASVITWTVCGAKAIELLTVRHRLRRNLLRLDAARSLAEALQSVDPTGPARALVEAAATEATLSGATAAEGIKERAASRLERIEAAAGRRLAHAMGILATIGATAPFVGLFGTVWGIMNSFIGISKAQTTNLAVVAPGIAEALLATAIGLVAAIPAVVIYNMFARRITACRALLGDVAATVLRLLSRDLDRGAEVPKLRSAAE